MIPSFILTNFPSYNSFLFSEFVDEFDQVHRSSHHHCLLPVLQICIPSCVLLEFLYSSSYDGLCRHELIGDIDTVPSSSTIFKIPSICPLAVLRSLVI